MRAFSEIFVEQYAPCGVDCRSVATPATWQLRPRVAARRVCRAALLAGLLLQLLLTGCSLLPGKPNPDNSSRARVVTTAFKMLGAPYHYGGHGPNGFDCSGLVRFSYQQAGIEVPRTAFDQYLRSVPVSNDRLLPGDLLFFTLKSRSISHVGIYVGDGKFIHAPAFGKQVMESRLDEPYWHHHLVRGGRLF
ncbi:MAG: C40 family peptidase [Gammaproteobacteria bacterium]